MYFPIFFILISSKFESLFDNFFLNAFPFQIFDFISVAVDM